MIGLSERALTWADKLKAELAEHRAKGLPVIWYASIDHYAEDEGEDFLVWEGYYTSQAKAKAALAEAKSGINPDWVKPVLVVAGGSYTSGIRHILVD